MVIIQRKEYFFINLQMIANMKKLAFKSTMQYFFFLKFFHKVIMAIMEQINSKNIKNPRIINFIIS